MKIVRDEELNGLLMIPLWNQYGLHNCSVKGCTEKQTTIVLELIEQPFALCETHYQQAKTSGKLECTLEL